MGFRSYLYDIIGKGEQLLRDASFMHSMFKVSLICAAMI